MATIDALHSTDAQQPGPETQAVIKSFEQYVIPNYRRFNVCLVRGEGSRVWDADGHSYLDLFPGWGCNLLGHCPRPVVQAVQKQMEKLIHVPNTWYMEPQGTWAKLLSERSFGGQAFFCNSGTEANEAAIKLVRLRSEGKRYKIITFEGGFHGRTMGSVSATAQPKYHDGLGPMVAGFQFAPHGDLDAVAALVDEQTGGILIEPILGEGGIVPASKEFLRGLRKIADDNDLLLVFDEVQSGCGRTGKWFGYQHTDVIPDVMTLSKSLCAGIAGGAMLTTPELAKHLRPGMHAATFGGNPIAAAAGIAAIQMIEEQNLLSHVEKAAELFHNQLNTLKSKCDCVSDIRIKGMMIGIELSIDGAAVVQACLDRRLLVNCTQGNVIRLLPAMTVTEAEIEEGCQKLTEAILDVASRK
ncbi:acetylornithine/succinylornithine family transaminase [Pirellulales bacterium]|jgi:predicted acetylornithine/succinylornithine family transaminase|nr:acetylornithine/succinylornithine family transaminase [Pirellulales bacterium]MDB4365362.1 acetylornithine/succinylornithine family transaminase [Pirellulales bacterium]MDB4475128.1 acetylornithine/succinylornithine family transaminase [Pirellulales bacterium]